MQSSLADGDWHSLTVVVEGSVATFYLDASRINSRYTALYLTKGMHQHRLLAANCREKFKVYFLVC